MEYFKALWLYQEQPERQTAVSHNLHHALDEVSASSAGGAPFLLMNGLGLLITAVITLFLPRETTALIAMFQGGISIPVALWLEKRLSVRRMSANNPLHKLSGLLNVSQMLALPILIVAYNVNHGLIPIMLAAIAGMHFVPYAWLHRTNLYLVLGIALAIGSFALQLIFGSLAYTLILFFMTAAYWLAAPLLYQHARQLAQT